MPTAVAPSLTHSVTLTRSRCPSGTRTRAPRAAGRAARAGGGSCSPGDARPLPGGNFGARSCGPAIAGGPAAPWPSASCRWRPRRAPSGCRRPCRAWRRARCARAGPGCAAGAAPRAGGASRRPLLLQLGDMVTKQALKGRETAALLRGIFKGG